MKKKQGKYEKRPKKKDMLLQTYFTSILSLVLCVTMFFGTSFAWFTSEVNNQGNEIYIGTLDVGFFVEGEANLGQAQWQDLSDEEVKLFDDAVRWEPGYTMLEKVKVVNEGDLAFNYVLNFTDPTVQKGYSAEDDAAFEAGTVAELSISQIAQFFDVWVYPHEEGATFTAPTSYSAITEENGWISAGSLADVLGGDFVLTGSMDEAAVRKENQQANEINDHTTDGLATEHTYTIALHMNDEATAEVMNHKIGLNVKLVAYQMVSESDALTNEYDKVKVISNLETLKNALSAANGNLLMVLDVEVEEETDVLTMNGGRLDGDSRKIFYTGENTDGDILGVLTTTGGKIANLVIEGGENGCALYITDLSSDLYVTGCTFRGKQAFVLESNIVRSGVTMNFTNTRFENLVAFDNVAGHAYFTNCTFTDVLKPSGDTTLKDCSLPIEAGKTGETGLNISELANGETITLENCVYKGILIDKAVITKSGNQVQVDNALLKITGDFLVLAGNS